jgi:hypothetical protein
MPPLVSHALPTLFFLALALDEVQYPQVNAVNDVV